MGKFKSVIFLQIQAAGDIPINVLPHPAISLSARSPFGKPGVDMGTSVAFPTNPSGVIGGTQFDPDYQFSPKWLSGTEAVR